MQRAHRHAASAPSRRRYRLAADLIDVALVVGVGTWAGMLLYAALLASSRGEEIELGVLAFGLLGFVLGAFVAAVTWIVVLTMASDSGTPGQRLLTVAPLGMTRPARVLRSIGRHITVVVVPLLLVLVRLRVREPGVFDGVLVPAMATSLLAALVHAVHLRSSVTPWSRTAAVAAVGLFVGAVVGVAVPNDHAYTSEAQGRAASLILAASGALAHWRPGATTSR